MENPARSITEKNWSNSQGTSSEGAIAIVQMIEWLRSVDINDPETELNATSISDNNGGRILL